MELTDIRTDTRFLISPQLTSTDYSDASLDRNVNRWYRTVFGWIVAAQGEWELNGDILTRDLQNGVTDYEVPSTMVRLYKVEAMYDSTVGFVPVRTISLQRDSQDYAEGNSSRTFDDSSQPTAELFGDWIQLKPAPTADVVNGLKIWAQLNFVDIDATTNDVPKVMDIVVRVLCYGAAYDYCLAEEMYKKANELKKIIYGDPNVKDDNGMKGQVELLYANKAATRRQRVTAQRRSFK